ncbi:hypothetical protein C8R41DRAFT_871113 [Lentinula lateritia]|uniref:Uncharacterized protein n=1 Tax=Lentinula lateritia TaxID=40482 RepID=A0ABQ8V120_9AGAR|nr:hypothetical protein C8R41DRAFT_871113 [Lentinula lateritia]
MADTAKSQEGACAAAYYMSEINAGAVRRFSRALIISRKKGPLQARWFPVHRYLAFLVPRWWIFLFLSPRTQSTSTESPEFSLNLGFCPDGAMVPVKSLSLPKAHSVSCSRLEQERL